MKKNLTDKNGKVIRKGSVVRYGDDGWVRVTAVFPGKQTVNLGGVFNGKLYHKGIPLGKVYEDTEAWYESWTQSETYKCM